MAQAADSNSLVMVLYFDYGSDTPFSLDKARDGMISGVKGTLLSEKAVSLGGHPGREVYVLAKTSDGREFILRARLYDAARRVYAAQFLSLKSDDGPALAEKGNKFFDSFKVEQAR